MLNPAIIIILTTIASICMLYYGASFLISGALSAASKFKISDTVVSITLIAGATSLPELFILFQAIHNPGGSTFCLLYTSPSPRDRTRCRMPSSA